MGKANICSANLILVPLRRDTYNAPKWFRTLEFNKIYNFRNFFYIGTNPLHFVRVLVALA
jgi:hypothetical protein